MVVVVKAVLTNIPENKYKPCIINVTTCHAHILIWTLQWFKTLILSLW